MLKRILKSRTAQNTAEYAILISLVVAGIIAMQTYAQRALQGRVRDAGQYLVDQTENIGTTVHYEPYYLSTEYNVVTDDATGESLVGNSLTKKTDSTRTREEGGVRRTAYDTNKFAELANGV